MEALGASIVDDREAADKLKLLGLEWIVKRLARRCAG